MKLEDFVEDIKTFQELYISEYMDEWEFIYNPDELTGRTVCEDSYGNKWEIPYSVYNEHGCDEVGIDIGDAGNLRLSEAGLYCFLWNDACARFAPKG